MPPKSASCRILLTLLFFQLPLLATSLCLQEHSFPENSTCTSLPAVQEPHVVLTPRVPASDFAWSVLAIGDSITAGVGSSDGNGYRLALHNLLAIGGHEVNFLGTEVTGDNNPDNRHEGYGAHRISQILRRVQEGGILNQQKRANVVLIHAGTNDNNIETTVDGVYESYAGTPDRLRTLIDYVLCRDANAVVLVALLIRNAFENHQQQTDALNAAIPGIVAERYQQGFKIRTVDMSQIGGAELSDILHPNDGGYKHMAQLWYTALMNIPSQWYITGPPAPTKFGGPVEVCAKGKSSFIPALEGRRVASGAHLQSDPGEPLSSSSPSYRYVPNWRDENTVAIGVGRNGSGALFADLDGDGIDDYLWVDYTSGSVRAWLHSGKYNWAGLNGGNEIAFGLEGTTYVEFADLNGDKRVEYILVANGHFRVFRNDGRNGDVWLWSEQVLAGQQLDDIFGGSAGFHYFGDMNGDGLADLVAINGNGVLDIWFNTGPSGDGYGWSACKNKGFHQGQMVLTDIDGDGRDDYLIMNPDGGVKGWLNKPGGSCGITWVPINGGSEQSVAFNFAPARQVRFADLDGDGKADYLVVADEGGAVKQLTNTGYSYTQPAPLGGYAAGVRLADINGDGQDDYLSVSDTSAVLAYVNGGESGDGGWAWAQQANGAPIAFGYSGATRPEIHFADVNGDGLDDFLFVHKDTGAVHCYLNRGPTTNQAWGWTIIEGLIAIGVGGAGSGVRFADYDGDGRADYIYVTEGGDSKVWINAGPGDVLTNWRPFFNGGLVTYGIGANVSDVHFADIDGDGKADYLWIDPVTGAVKAWYNLMDGTTPNWQSAGEIASGVQLPGQNIRFARVGKSGRADYVALDEDTGAFRVWYNGCSEVIGSRAGSGTCLGPPLPPQSSPEVIPTGLPATSGCVSSPCTPCTGNSCRGCSGNECSGCTGLGCYGCKGANCNICIGLSCAGCRNSDCVLCQGSDCLNGDNSCEGSGCAINFPSTTTDSGGRTVISQSGQGLTLPTGITQLTTITAPGGGVFTFTPTTSAPTTSSSSGIPLGILIPIRTSVPEPRATDSGTEIPCTLWFFTFCLRWEGLEIGGWLFDFPPGIRGPYPPPQISFPPIPNFTWSLKDPLPTWPTLTIGPDRKPTYSPKPTDGPDRGCKTQTAELCMTTTSFSVSSTSTNTRVASTCATIYGCEASNSATEVTTGCTSQLTSTNYYVSCSTTAPAALSCTTTSSSTTTGCSVTATTVTCGALSPTAPPDPACSADRYSFIVYPKDGKNAGQVSNIQNMLNGFVGDPTKISSRSSSGLGTLYWRVPLSFNESAEIEQSQDVAGIHDDCGNQCAYSPNTAQNYQDSRHFDGRVSVPQLPFLSWPPGQASNPHPDEYYFDNSLGSTIPVYVVDTGATLSHPEFDALRGRTRWLQAGTGPDAEESDTGGGGFHGTSMLAAIAGLRLGVAKNISPIIVRAPGPGRSFRNQNPTVLLDSLALIDADLGADSTRARAIVSMSLYYPRTGGGLWTVRGQQQESSIAADAFEGSLSLVLASLARKGAILVTGSGNRAPFEQLPPEFSDGWPANLGKLNNRYRIPSLMVVGAMKPDGRQIAGRHDLPQGIPQLYAPGIDLMGTVGDDRSWGNPVDPVLQYIPGASGTSFATAHTAGLAAYFLRLSQLGLLKDRDGNFVDTPAAIKNFIINEATWSRADVAAPDWNLPSAARPAIWNRADLGLTYCPWNPNAAVNRLRRQASSPTCSIPGNTPSPTQGNTGPSTTQGGGGGGGGSGTTITSAPAVPTLKPFSSGQPAASLFFAWYPGIDRNGYLAFSSEHGVLDYTVSGDYPAYCASMATNTVALGASSSQPASEGTYPATLTYTGAIQGHTGCAFTALDPVTASGGVLRCADTTVRCSANPSPTKTGCCVSGFGVPGQACPTGNLEVYEMVGCFF